MFGTRRLPGSEPRKASQRNARRHPERQRQGQGDRQWQRQEAAQQRRRFGTAGRSANGTETLTTLFQLSLGGLLLFRTVRS
jgi:hypothetical protein